MNQKTGMLVDIPSGDVKIAIENIAHVSLIYLFKMVIF